MDHHSDRIEVDLPSPSAPSVLPFPLNRRRRKIITAARTLEERKTDDGKLRYWNRTIADLHTELRSHGVDEATSMRELERFQVAVSAELSNGHRQQGPGEVG